MIYVTYQFRPTSFARSLGAETERYAVKCRTYDQALGIISDLNSLDGVSYIRINRCGQLKNRNTIKIVSGDEYWKKCYGTEYVG